MVKYRARGQGISVLVINEANIRRASLPGGMIYSGMRTIGREVAEAAQADLVPGHGMRTGGLRDSIGSSVTPTITGVQVNVRATKFYARYVHQGTYGPIFPRVKKMLVWQGDATHPGKHVRKWVSGQAANPFLTRAMELVLRLRGIVRL